MRDELADARLQARSEQAQLIRSTDQCLAETLALATKESAERNTRMTREIERLLNDHDSTYSPMMTSLEKRLVAKADLMMRKLDEILKGSNGENRCGPMEDKRQATNGSVTHRHTEAPPRSGTNFDPNHRERPRAAPSRAGWTNAIMREADATSGARLPTGPQVRSVPDLTIISHDSTMYALMFEPLKRSLETFITKLSKSTERGERSRNRSRTRTSQIAVLIEVMKLHFEEKKPLKQECSALTSNLEGTALSCVMAKKTNV